MENGICHAEEEPVEAVARLVAVGAPWNMATLWVAPRFFDLVGTPARACDSRERCMWSTPVSAAFYAAIIIVALILAKLLVPFIDLAPR